MFRSTRGKKEYTASEAILKGIAPDGGLFVTNVSKAPFEEWIDYSYKDIAKNVFAHLLDDYTKEEIEDIVNRSYTNTFDVDSVVLLKHFGNLSFLETFHGNTKAFKDVALNALPNLLSVAKKKHNIENKTIILTATSGDTGSAALNGFSGIEGIEIYVLYPNNRVSRIQEAQMNHFQGGNCHVISVNGNFDDCQTMVKELLNDEDIKNRFDLSSANSINIGRLIPQIVYYFYSYFDLVHKNTIKFGDKINFTVPTGNFGDILAGYYARKMGLPIKKLICASNQNNVLTDFFKTGIYDANRKFTETISPSMDILISSNLERLLFEYLQDSDKVKALMDDLKANRKYTMNISDSLFTASFASEADTLEAIKEVYDKYQYVIDPHTAVAYKVYKDYLANSNDTTANVIISTASPFKFVNSVSKALDLPLEDEYDQMANIASKGNIEAPKSFLAMRNEAQNKIVWEKQDTIKNLKDMIEGKN